MTSLATRTQTNRTVPFFDYPHVFLHARESLLAIIDDVHRSIVFSYPFDEMRANVIDKNQEDCKVEEAEPVAIEGIVSIFHLEPIQGLLSGAQGTSV